MDYPASPYVAHYKLSNQVPIDPRYWDLIMRYLRDNGVRTYEQDWMNDKALPRLDHAADADLFLDGMAHMARKYGVGLQYCMPLPRHFLQGSRYSNLHSIRTSGDGFERGKWTQFIYGSRFASALGIWPWADVSFSQDRENVLIANLSAGIVGVGDRLSAASDPNGDYNPSWCKKDVDCRTPNVENLRRVMRTDGVLVKPDSALVPTDQSYLDTTTMVASASSGSSAVYLFAYSRLPRVSGVSSETSVEIDPKALGFVGAVYLYRYFDKMGEVILSGHTKKMTVDRQGTYLILVPVEQNGLAILGDPNLFVSMGRQRVICLQRTKSRRPSMCSLQRMNLSLKSKAIRRVGLHKPISGKSSTIGTRIFHVRIHKPTSLTSKPWTATITLSTQYR